MAKIVKQITDAKSKGSINVYAVYYGQKEKEKKNFAVALPGTFNEDWIGDFCENIIKYKNANEVEFNSTSDGLDDDTYEYVQLDKLKDKYDEINALICMARDYCGENRKKVPYANLFVCKLNYENSEYLLCAKQRENSDKLFRGKRIFMSQQDELKRLNSKEIFAMSCYSGFIVDTSENKVLIFDKKSFQDVFKYDDLQKEIVKEKISIIDGWGFLESPEVIKEKCEQKNVYRNLIKVFMDEQYLGQMKSIEPAQLKENLLRNCPNDFSEDDFKEEKLMVTAKNLAKVMKMLAKGFRYNFFTNTAESI